MILCTNRPQNQVTGTIAFTITPIIAPKMVFLSAKHSIHTQKTLSGSRDWHAARPRIQPYPAKWHVLPWKEVFFLASMHLPQIKHACEHTIKKWAMGIFFLRSLCYHCFPPFIHTITPREKLCCENFQWWQLLDIRDDARFGSRGRKKGGWETVPFGWAAKCMAKFKTSRKQIELSTAAGRIEWFFCFVSFNYVFFLVCLPNLPSKCWALD